MNMDIPTYEEVTFIPLLTNYLNSLRSSSQSRSSSLKVEIDAKKKSVLERVEQLPGIHMTVEQQQMKLKKLNEVLKVRTKQALNLSQTKILKEYKDLMSDE